MKPSLKNALVLTSATIIVTCFFAFRKDPNSGKANKNTGISLKNLDTSVSPATDFFKFVNGNWVKNNPVPPSESRWASFNEVRDANYAILKEVLESAAADTKAVSNSNRKKIGDFYASGMDSAKLEKQGFDPIKKDLATINSIKDINGVLDFVSGLQSHFNFAMFSVFAQQDMKNSTRTVAYVNQGGLSLPDRDYYLKSDSRSEEIRSEYQKHIINMLMLTGQDKASAEADAKTILEIETKLAKVSMSRVDMRNPEKTYNLKTLDEMSAIAPAIDWKNHFAKLGIVNQKELVTNNPEFFTELSNLLKTYPVDSWKSYLKWKVVRDAAPQLSSAFAMEDFHFRQGVLTGTKQMKERWKLVQETIDNSMGEALGEVYCEKAFTPATKKRMMELVNNLALAFEARIAQLDWMSDATKVQAQLKLSTIMKKIGYPDKWRDYSALAINRDSYYENASNAAAFEFKFMVGKIGKPVDRAEWGITPPTVNAYYNPSMNEIVFPAGILQPPFFNPDADDAINYGSIGAVIGHEMTHGFDDEGRQFDSEGNLKSWWTSEDSAKFVAKTDILVYQYNGFVVNDSLHVNGELTLGENIADLGGLTIAYYAFQKSMEGKPVPPKIDGYTAEQRFFMGFGTVWRSTIRPEAAAQRIITDPHSPTNYRCNGVLSNMPEFYKAFNVKPGDPMYLEASKRAAIW